MKKILLIGMIFFSISAAAQLADIGGALAISGQMTNNSMNMFKKALNTAEVQNLINKIRMEVIEAKSQMRGYYNKAKAEVKKIPVLAEYEGTIEANTKEIIVTLFHVKQYECEQMAQLGAKLINLNNGKYDPLFCQYDNMMKFIFD